VSGEAQGLCVDGSKRVYALWAAGFGLLTALALFCWLLLAPFLQARDAIDTALGRKEVQVFGTGPNAIRLPVTTTLSRTMRHQEDALRQLGGPQAAAPKLAVYLRAPRSLAPHRRTAVLLMSHCGELAVPALTRLLDDDEENIRWSAQMALKIIHARQASAGALGG